MGGLDTIRRQNQRVAERELKGRYMGQTVEATDSWGTPHVGVVSAVEVPLDGKAAYLLAGRVGIFHNPVIKSAA